MFSEKDLLYFQRGQKENPRFFARLGCEPSFEGCTALDVGCGHGSLCAYIAERGAKKVVGIDTDARRIQFAQENIAVNYPSLAERCDFFSSNISHLDGYMFDTVVSKDTFEHIIELRLCLAQIVDRLIPGGRLYVGFGPLYYSPFGDHRRTGARIPWGHVTLPEEWLLRRLNRSRSTPVQSVEDLGLNKLKLPQYKTIFEESGLEIESWRVNSSNHPVSALFRAISKFRPLRDYFSHNLYCILRKPT